MASQGWKPGQYLGAEDANHSGHYTQANASHIRVMLRDDNLGLGAQKSKSTAETFGLSTLSSIFGRLNGKTDVEVQKQQDTQRDWQLRSFQAQKYGFMNFVSGGLLVGDKMELPEQGKVIETVDEAVKGEDAAGQKKSKKRKAEGDNAEGSGKAKKRRSKGADALEADEAEEVAASKMSKKERKKRKTEDAAADSSDERSAAKASRKDKKLKMSDESEDAPLDDEKRLKQEKRARKEERRRRKEEKRAKKAAKATPREQSTDSSSAEEDVPKAVQPPVAAQQMFAGSRHAVRQRYIMQKRMASMNAQAMSEILMLKAGA